MDYWAIFRSDRPKAPISFIRELPTVDIVGYLEDLNNLDAKISYWAEPRSFDEVEQQKAGN